MAGDRKACKRKTIAAIEHGSGNGAESKHNRLDQHDARESHRQLSGGGVKTGGKQFGDKEWSENLSENDDQSEDQQEQCKHMINEAPGGLLPIAGIRAQQNRYHGAGERSAGDEAEESIGQTEGCVVGIRFDARAELGVEQDLPESAEGGRGEEGGHQDEGGFGDGQLSREDAAQIEAACPAHRSAEAGHGLANRLQKFGGLRQAHPGTLGEGRETAEHRGQRGNFPRGNGS